MLTKEEFNIEVTIFTGTSGRFRCVFTSAAEAFTALNEFLVGESRECYFTHKMDELMHVLLDIKLGRMNSNTCNLFELSAIQKEKIK